jgi:hypothetical protein
MPSLSEYIIHNYPTTWSPHLLQPFAECLHKVVQCPVLNGISVVVVIIIIIIIIAPALVASEHVLRVLWQCGAVFVL